MISAFTICENNDIASQDRFFACCERAKVPFVVILRRRKWVSIDWDCISLPLEYDVLIDQNEYALEDGLRELFRECANPRSNGSSIYAYVGSFDFIAPEYAENVAARVFEILNAVLPKGNTGAG